MKRIITALLVGLFVGAGIQVTYVQGPLTNALNLRVRSDANGSLMVTAATAAAQGPLTAFGNIRLKTDANGYLIVAMNGGDGSVPTGVAVGSVLASNGVGVQGVWSASPTLTTLTLGTNPATAGFLRSSNGAGWFSRNSTNASDNLVVGYGIAVADTVTISQSNIDIQWGRTLIALGGGAAPTLGTIGATGPATAAQNSWMRVIDSAGAAFWVPAWK